jgi:hypothetical protein
MRVKGNKCIFFALISLIGTVHLQTLLIAEIDDNPNICPISPCSNPPPKQNKL